MDGVGFGSDFDGVLISKEIGDVSGLPRLMSALRDRGYDDQALRKVAHENWVRVLGKTWGGCKRGQLADRYGVLGGAVSAGPALLVEKIAALRVLVTEEQLRPLQPVVEARQAWATTIRIPERMHQPGNPTSTRAPRSAGRSSRDTNRPIPYGGRTCRESTNTRAPGAYPRYRCSSSRAEPSPLLRPRPSR